MGPIKIKTLASNHKRGQWPLIGVGESFLFLKFSYISHSHFYDHFLLPPSPSLSIFSNFSLKFLHNHKDSSIQFQVCWRGRDALQGEPIFLLHFKLVLVRYDKLFVSSRAICVVMEHGSMERVIVTFGLLFYVWEIKFLCCLWYCFCCIKNWSVYLSI